MATFSESSAADWDSFQAQQGVSHEQPANTDYGPADELQMGNYPTTLSNLTNLIPLQEDSGDANDIVGGGTSTADLNAPTKGVTGILGGSAFEFDQSNFEGLQFGAEGRHSSVTALAWVTYGNSNNWAAVVGNADYGNNQGWAVITTDTGGEMRVDIGLGSTRTNASAGNIDDGNRHLVGFRYDASDLDLLIDGSVAATTPETEDIDYSSAKDLRVGRRADAGNYWGGKINYVMIFNTAISDSLHTDIYDTVQGTAEYWASKQTT